MSDLSCFHDVAVSGSFSAAANRLGKTQPSLSLAVKRIENILNTDLFHRNKTGVTLTRAGEKLLPYVEDLLKRWQNIKAEVLSSHYDLTGQITIGCHMMMCSYIGDFMSYLLRKYPGIEINLKMDTSENLCQQVLDSVVDIAIVLNPTMHQNFVVQKAIDTDYTFWNMSSADPLQSLSSGEAVIICDPTIPYTDHLINQLTKSGFSYSRVMHTSGMESVANLTYHGCGVGVLPSCYVTGVFDAKLSRIDESPYLRNETCLIYRYESKAVVAVQAILSEIKQHIQGNFDHVTKMMRKSA